MIPKSAFDHMKRSDIKKFFGEKAEAEIGPRFIEPKDVAKKHAAKVVTRFLKRKVLLPAIARAHRRQTVRVSGHPTSGTNRFRKNYKKKNRGRGSR